MSLVSYIKFQDLAVKMLTIADKFITEIDFNTTLSDFSNLGIEKHQNLRGLHIQAKSFPQILENRINRLYEETNKYYHPHNYREIVKLCELAAEELQYYNFTPIFQVKNLKCGQFFQEKKICHTLAEYEPFSVLIAFFELLADYTYVPSYLEDIRKNLSLESNKEVYGLITELDQSINDFHNFFYEKMSLDDQEHILSRIKISKTIKDLENLSLQAISNFIVLEDVKDQYSFAAIIANLKTLCFAKAATIKNLMQQQCYLKNDSLLCAELVNKSNLLLKNCDYLYPMITQADQDIENLLFSHKIRALITEENIYYSIASTKIATITLLSLLFDNHQKDTNLIDISSVITLEDEDMVLVDIFYYVPDFEG